MRLVLNEYWIVFEITSDYVFRTIYDTEEEAQQHVTLRTKSVKGTDMEGRPIIYKRYVVLE